MEAASRLPRRTALIAAAVVLSGSLALTSCSAATTTSSTSTEASVDTDVSTAALWDASSLHDVSLEVDETTISDAIQEYLDTGEKVWIEASVTIDGVTYESVGLKLKGNSTLRGVSTDADPATLPWIIRLDKFVDGQTLNGETDIVIRGNVSASSLNEAVALTLLDETGLATENATATRFTVNGGTAQLRLAVQKPSDGWLEQEYGTTSGGLYKAETGGDYSYRGEDPDAYTDVFDQEAGESDLTPLIDFLQLINEADDATFAAELSQHLDVEAFAKYLAFQELVDNYDDIDGPGNNSYLYYDADTGLMSVVTWDLNLTFGVRNSGFGGGGDQGADRPVAQGARGAAGGAGGGGAGGGAGGNILSERFLENETFAALVEDAKAELTETLVDSGKATAVLDVWTALLQSEASDLISEETLTEEADAIRTYFE
ncbi:MAG: CotH kinase family protein [Microbacterium sp.]|uniref:CotH kinase family protein n=1 Tax=Microbacterium sp. TaxID=51671 RepID=UPI0027225BB3|nr:CotH kinase family protein [Microbacterium sp.]MDO8384200.1 CotH kinase family protein [Microbacterium sp.]